MATFKISRMTLKTKTNYKNIRADLKEMYETR